MPNSIKFYYFGVRGRSHDEAIFHLLKLGNVQYEEVVIDEDTWPCLKEG